MPSDPAFLEVRLTLLTKADGGRHTPTFSNYRPNWDTGGGVGGNPAIAVATVTFDHAPMILPGETAIVRLVPVQPEFWSHVRVGQEIVANEGVRVVGKAIVLRVEFG
jgi:translation elongation factor EF-Tu-like GTPase